MPLNLYCFPTSSNSRIVLTFLAVNDIPYEKKIINLLKKEQKSPEYLKINPLGLIPAIDDDGFYLNESEAIIRYLINTRETKEKYYPNNPKQRALIDRYLPFHHTQVALYSSRYFKSTYKMIFPDFPYKVEEVKSELLDTYDKFEKFYLKDNKYLAGGDDITIADMFAINSLSQVYYTIDFDYSQFPKLKAYIERVLEHPVVKEVNIPVKEFGETLKNQKE